ncbi:agmatine deiminase family protein [Streptomyces sp. A5-4]|uniref:agmatine deiminase family protein n=1 Tax=Streptomyces sp. A5-4 TaxID=3384771 RepID=UPI003DA8CE70
MGTRMPAEWAEHEACLMAWPTRQELGARPTTGRWGVRGGGACQLRLRAGDHDRRAGPGRGAGARSACGEQIEVIELPTDDSWLRDSGPIFAFTQDGERVGVDFRFDVVRATTDEAVVMRAGRIVERGPTERLLADPRHACTRLLLESVPRPGWNPHRIAAARRALDQ